MSEDQQQNSQNTEPIEDAPKLARRYFSRRNLLGTFVVLLLLAGILALVGLLAYRNGLTDTYIKTQFVEKMNYMGIEFTADVFRVRVNPLELELKNATFNDRTSGEKLFFIRDARLGLTIKNLFAWQISRDIKVDSTEIIGAEVWVKFDETGRSNFANLVEDTRASNINLKYDSVRFTLRESVIHFGDVSRRIGADANNLQVSLEPESFEVSDEQKRYKVRLTSVDSMFTYEESVLKEIDLGLTAVADGKGADISELKVETPIGTTYLSGKITSWSDFTYDLAVESSVDLTQTSNLFPLGASLSGVGNFKGKVTGSGETYKFDGSIDSQAIAAEGVYLKALNVAATVEGTNSNYEANGNAVAELLTFEDFKIDFPRISGNVRGTGTDFRWVGELQAIAAKSNALTLGRLFLSDAVAEYKDKELSATAGSGRVQKFSIGDTEIAELAARNLRFALRNGQTELSGPNATARSFKTDDYQLNGITGQGLRVSEKNGRTEVDIRKLNAKEAIIDDSKLRDLTADDFKLRNLPRSTELNARNLRAQRLDSNGVRVEGIEAPTVSVKNTSGETIIYSDKLRVAKIDTASAVLGSLNIGGVRLTIRQGRIQGTSNDIDAGTVSIKKSDNLPDGGSLENVTVVKPVFVLEPSGRYRASADMSIGGGIVGSVPLGRANAKVDINNDRVALNELVADVMDGSVNGRAEIAIRNNVESNITGEFTGLDLSKLIAIQSGRVIPFEGKTNGNVDLRLIGTDVSTASGTIKATIDAAAGNDDRGRIPIRGNIDLAAVNGLFNIDKALLETEKSKFNGSGRFDLRNTDSELGLSLVSTDANEVDRIFRLLGFSPELERQLDDFQVQVAGNLEFSSKLTGNLNDPVLDGTASVASLSLRGREVGSVRSGISRTPEQLEFTNGLLSEPGGRGEIAFSVKVPSIGTNNISVKAGLQDVNAGNLLAALPVDLPERLRDFNGLTSGKVDLVGLPDNARGDIDISSANGTIAGEPFDRLNAKAVFSGTRIEIETAEIRVNDGALSAKGFYDRSSTEFDLDLTGTKIPLQLALSFLPPSSNVPTFSGATDMTAKATGNYDRPSSYNITFNGVARDVVINENQFGEVVFRGTTEDQVLKAELEATLDEKLQSINAKVTFSNANLPFTVEHAMLDSPLRPFFALIPQLRGISIGGSGTGLVQVGGNLSTELPDGTREFSPGNIAGSATFSKLSLQIQDTPLTATETVVVRFNPSEITFDTAKFAGGGSNLTIAGTKALSDEGINDLSITGRVNLALLNVIPPIAATDTFFGGVADLSVRLSGINKTARLIGRADTENASIAAFVGSDRISFDRVKAGILFTTNQVQIESAEGYLGGGQFNANGGVLLSDNLQIKSYRVGVVGTNVTVPLPDDFITTGDARLEITGDRVGLSLTSLISGSILARRSLYTKDIDLANIVGARREGSISGGSSGSVFPTRFDLTIDGRNALVIKNNIADLTASASLRVTGTSADPQISGRIVATEGTVFFRKDRYEVQRGVLEFPPNTSIEPVINLIAESEINGYQVFVNLNGSLTDTELLNATVRSSPALPQADVISLITTGSLSNTESGIPTLASTGINTAAEVLTDSIINNPARRATDRLFGLNVFEIDPIISGERINPTARLTVGRQINNNLRVTYATNLSQDQNQVLALEYRVSNKLSVIAQYEQRSLSNVTSNRDNFSIEVRFRRRF